MVKPQQLFSFLAAHSVRTLKRVKVDVLDPEVKLSPQERMLKKWYRTNGNVRHLVVHNLNQESIVWEAGGYLGDWTAEIAARYNPRLFVFEPMSEFYRQLNERFTANEKITLINAGVWSRNETHFLSKNNDSSSIIRSGENGEKVKMIDIVQFARKRGFSHIDLFQINIEGAEYELLEHIIKTGFHKKVRKFQIQFHIDIPNSVKRRNTIVKELDKTHMRSFSYPFVWEGWRLK